MCTKKFAPPRRCVQISLHPPRRYVQRRFRSIKFKNLIFTECHHINYKVRYVQRSSRAMVAEPHDNIKKYLRVILILKIISMSVPVNWKSSAPAGAISAGPMWPSPALLRRSVEAQCGLPLPCWGDQCRPNVAFPCPAGAISGGSMWPSPALLRRSVQAQCGLPLPC